MMEIIRHATRSVNVPPVKTFAEVEEDRKPVTEMAAQIVIRHNLHEREYQNAPKMSSNKDIPKR
jgi:hypothetical protein